MFLSDAKVARESNLLNAVQCRNNRKVGTVGVTRSISYNQFGELPIKDTMFAIGTLKLANGLTELEYCGPARSDHMAFRFFPMDIGNGKLTFYDLLCDTIVEARPRDRDPNKMILVQCSDRSISSNYLLGLMTNLYPSQCGLYMYSIHSTYNNSLTFFHPVVRNGHIYMGFSTPGDTGNSKSMGYVDMNSPYASPYGAMFAYDDSRVIYIRLETTLEHTRLPEAALIEELISCYGPLGVEIPDRTTGYKLAVSVFNTNEYTWESVDRSATKGYIFTSYVNSLEEIKVAHGTIVNTSVTHKILRHNRVFPQLFGNGMNFYNSEIKILIGQTRMNGSPSYSMTNDQSLSTGHLLPTQGRSLRINFRNTIDMKHLLSVTESGNLMVQRDISARKSHKYRGKFVVGTPAWKNISIKAMSAEPRTFGNLILVENTLFMWDNAFYPIIDLELIAEKLKPIALTSYLRKQAGAVNKFTPKKDISIYVKLNALRRALGSCEPLAIPLGTKLSLSIEYAQDLVALVFSSFGTSVLHTVMPKEVWHKAFVLREPISVYNEQEAASVVEILNNSYLTADK